ncbi:MAG: hypothetical protein Fur0017_12620 [Anaerolineales bacterium]
MAGSAVRTELTGMFARLGVAVHTGSRRRETGVVEGGIFPIRWVVTRLALGSILSVVLIILFMAGVAVFWRTFEDIVDMAFFTGNVGVFTFQFERGEIMVEGGVLPRRWVMAGLAVGTVGAVVLIILVVA